MLVIGHLPKGTEGRAAGFSGSTAREASARSMWKLEKKTENVTQNAKKATENDTEADTYWGLEHTKSNYAPRQPEIYLAKQPTGWWIQVPTEQAAIDADKKYQASLTHTTQEDTDVEFKAKALFGNDTEPLCYERDENGQYTDKRLQACYDDGVIAELLQAIGRGRFVSRPVTVVVWCSHSLPGITDREQTFLFDETDWQQARGNLEKLQDIVTHRETYESSGDVKAMESAGVSERTAYRRTAEKRTQKKAERDAEIRRRDANGETQQQIADALGIGLATVNRVLRNIQKNGILNRLCV